MTEQSLAREHRVADAFVTLAGVLVTGYDLADLFHDLSRSCVDLLDVTAAGLMLVDAGGRLRVVASSSERSRLLELMEIQNDEGPCLDCHRDGAAVVVGDLGAERDRWPSFAAEALRVGFGAVYALPMRLRDETVGALNLFHETPSAVTDSALRLGQALADVATIAIVSQRSLQDGIELNQQLQNALNSRVVIEQAKGMLVGRLGVALPVAFELLRGYARRTNQTLSGVAQRVVVGDLGVESLQP